MNQSGSGLSEGIGFKNSARPWPWLCLLLAIGLSLFSVIARVHFIQTRPLAGRLDGQEPESHILVTDLAFEQTSWRIHHFLPIFTLGAPYDKYIDDHPGAESTDKFGNYYYTSSPPLTFALPYFAVRSAGAQPSLENLRWYNITLQIAAALALAALVFLCAKRAGADAGLTLIASATAMVVYMTAPECLKSHSINLWAQQFYALLLMVQLICFLFHPRPLLLFAFAFIGCLADWTPYLANSAMAAVALWSFDKNRDPRALKSAVAILAGCLAGGLSLIIWFASVMPIGDYFHDLLLRSSARSGFFPEWAMLIISYSNSFGFFSLIGLIALFCRPWSGSPPERPVAGSIFLPGKNPLVIALVIIAFALLENPIMAGHAVPYSYDRLKAVQLLALFAALAALRRPKLAFGLFFASVAAGVCSIFIFLRIYDTPGGWGYVHESVQQRLGKVIFENATTNGPALFNGEVRGAEVFYARRDLVMCSTNNATVLAQNWCAKYHFPEATVFEISGHYPDAEINDLPRSVHISRVYADGKIADLGVVTLPEKPGDYHPRLDPDHPFENLRLAQFVKLLLWQ
ncbi:MAG: hypothetical protein ACLQSR_01490 [Limisphaerales bacterium]